MNPFSMMVNAARRVEAMFPGYFAEAKHNHYKDYGYPTTLAFEQFRSMYERNSVATAAVNKTTKKIWESRPELLEEEEAHDETTLEAEIRKHFERIRVWQLLAVAERRSFIAGYSGVVLRIADDKPFNQPLENVSSGLEALVEVIPASAGQLKVSEWHDDEADPDYGKPKMFAFDENAVGSTHRRRKFDVHPSRVIVWSDDGTVHCRSMLEPGYNDLITLEKIAGAGGEGFWKNAKSAPVLEVDKDAKLKEMASAMGVKEDEVIDKFNEVVEGWQKGFDQLLMVQGMQAKSLAVSLPSPEHFFGISLQSFAAGVDIPVKILIGNITGERASTEDAKEFAKTCMGRRSDKTIPSIMAFVDRLTEYGILPEMDWHLKWTDLTESSMDEKIARADKMAGINQKMEKSGEIAFTHDEIREAVDKEPLSDADKYRDDDGTGALPPDQEV